MKKNILIFIIFFAIVVLLTFPLFFKITTHIPGFFSTDEPYGLLWEGWRIEYSLDHKLSFRHPTLIGYPYGVDLYTSGYPFTAIGRWGLNILTTNIIAWNIMLILNFWFSSIFTFLLVFYLSKSRAAAFFSAIIFSFCPYQFIRTWQHLGLTCNEWIPLCLLTAILLKDKPSKRNTVLFLVGILLAFSVNYMIMYFSLIALIVFFIYLLFYNWRTKFFKDRQSFKDDFRYLLKVAIVGIISFIILFPQFSTLIKNRLKPTSITAASDFNPYLRPFEHLFSQSARPLSYFLPASVHPVFGKVTKRFVGSGIYGDSFTEHTLYLGWIPLMLAFVAFRQWRKNKKLSAISHQPCAKQEDFYIGFFIFLAIAAWLFSQPPWWKIGPIKVFMPSFFMYKILPMYRAYCRFGIVVMLAIAVLAGFGLKFILEKFKTQKAKIAIATICCSLVLFEFWNYPPFKVIDVSKVPEVYYWLKEQPHDFAIAEYPLDVNGPNEMYRFYQTKHEKKIINGTIPGTYPNMVAMAIVKLSNPNTAGILKWMGVKYVVVHKEDYIKTELIKEIEELDKISLNPGLKFVKSFSAQECPQKNIICVQKTGPIDVYEVTALPVEYTPKQ